MGIIAKGQTVKVVGSDVKVELHMRGRCEKYGAYDYTVGKCTTDGGMETVSDEYTRTTPSSPTRSRSAA